MSQSNDPRYRPDRYRHLYYDGDLTLPVNKLGIKDLAELYRLENQARDDAYERVLSGEVRLRGPLTVALIMEFHRQLFGHLFEWGGRPRGLPLAPWTPPQFIAEQLKVFEGEVLSKHTPAVIKTDEQFCYAASEIHGEFITIHPFWNGNHRTIQLAIDALARATGRPVLNYDRNEQAKERFTKATELAYRKMDYGSLNAIMREALERAHTLSVPKNPELPQSREAIKDRVTRALENFPDSSKDRSIDAEVKKRR